MFNLANGRGILKFNKLVLVQKSFSSLFRSLILNLYIVCDLNNCPRNPTDNFTLKLTRNAKKKKVNLLIIVEE